MSRDGAVIVVASYSYGEYLYVSTNGGDTWNQRGPADATWGSSVSGPYPVRTVVITDTQEPPPA